MSVLFSDGFNRADGPLGSDWGVTGGSWAVITHTAHTVGGGWAYPTHQFGSANQEIWFTVNPTATTGGQIAGSLWNSPAISTFVGAWISPGAPRTFVKIYQWTGGGAADLSTAYLALDWTDPHRFVFRIQDGEAELLVDGKVCLRAYPTVSNAGRYAAWYSSTALYYLDDVWLEDLAGPPLSAVPGDVTNVGDDVTLELYSGNGGWTPGTPGSPTFTADLGTIIDQTILTESHAQVTYRPGPLVTSDRIRDPFNLAIADLQVSDPLTPSTGTGGGGGLTDAEHTWLSDLFDSLFGGTTSPNWQLLLDFLALWAPNGKLDQDQVALLVYTWLVNDPDSPSALNRLIGVQGVVDANYGAINYISSSGTKNIQSVLDAMSSVQVDLQPVLSQLSAIRTGANFTLLDLITQFTQMRTGNNLTLQSVIDAFPAEVTVDQSAVLAAIHDVRGAGNPDLAQIVGDLASKPSTTAVATMLGVNNAVLVGLIGSALAANFAALSAEHGAILAAVAGDALSGIISDALSAALAGLIDGVVNGVLAGLRPFPESTRYPGQSMVTMGTAVPLAPQVTLDVPCDGLMVSIDTSNVRNPYYTLGNVRSYKGIGAASFKSDNGFYEPTQQFGFSTAMIVPKTIAHPIGAVLRCTGGVAGTVTPWTLMS